MSPFTSGYTKLWRGTRRLLIRSGIADTPAWGMAKRLDDAFERLGLHAPSPETETIALLERLIKPGMTFLDLGASIGLYTLLAAELVGPTGRVYAFEPNPGPYNLLSDKVRARHYSWVRLVDLAVSNASVLVTFFADQRYEGSSGLYDIPGRTRKRVSVQAVSLDEFMATAGWPPVHIVKMDIEGSERAALDGMTELCTRNPSLKLIMEYADTVVRAANIRPQEIFDTLLTCGLSEVSIIESQLHPLSFPDDIDELTHRASYGVLNLLCQRPNRA